ncbi:MAG TPA: undecaprenyl-diphosphate phosphatase [Acidimicrobiia bacterium]|nr:undecaprenyl-diphosphate phosphatase [Acidimicrobiia bacterium]
MPILHAVVLGIVQGLSEFLPISSSGHLILVPELFKWTELTDHPSLNKTFDVALHVGTFVGAAWYFRHDLARYISAAWRSLWRRSIRSVDERMAWLLLISAIPGALVGAAFEGVIEDHLGQPVLIGVMFIVFAVVLYIADDVPQRRHQDDFRLRDALLMGGAQALALQPGVSRSGVTISMGRWLMFDRTAATRLSFLMSLPIIAGAGLFKGAEVVRDGGIPDRYVAPFIWGMVAAAVSAFIVIALLLRFLQRHSFTPFVIYRIAVGAAIILIFASGLR